MWDGVSHPSRWIPQSGNRIERAGKCQQLPRLTAEFAEDAEVRKGRSPLTPASGRRRGSRRIARCKRRPNKWRLHLVIHLLPYRA